VKGDLLNIIVCIKEIPDPEIPPAKFKLDSEAMHVIPPEGIPPVLNPYDAQAVEIALQLKERNSGKITVITIARSTASGAIKYALAMGADEGIILADDSFEGSDSFSTAYILSQAIGKMGAFDLVLCGRQAADWDEGLVGSIVAENLGLPLVTLAKEIEVADREFRVKRVILDGYQLFAAPIPAVVTISSEASPPRLPSGWGIISASRKQALLWSADDIDADLSQIGTSHARKQLIKLFIPKRERKCEIIQRETAEEASGELAQRLKKAGVI
jgi:electron transfer flavoprotein beta subunit